MFDTVIVRFGGEIGIKAPYTRKQYERRLNINIKASLKHHHVPYSALSRIPGRLYIRTNRAEETARKLSKVFGISSLSPVFTTSSSLDEILNASTQFANRIFRKRDNFAVRCHRVGTHPYTSQEICAKVGEHILTSLKKLNLTVDLTNPKRSLQLEIRDQKTYLFTDVIKGAAGLPLGTQPKLVCLLEDDARSAAACWMTMKRGCPQVLVNIAESLTASRKKAGRLRKTAKTLMEWSIGFPPKLRIAYLNGGVEKTLAKYPSELASIVRKRLMFRIAQRISEATRAEGIVTGESLGKDTVRSIHSFRILDEAVKGLPVYRPLLGLGDNELASMAEKIGLKTVMRKARQLGTETVMELGRIKEVEYRLDSEKIIDDTVKSMKTIELGNDLRISRLDL